MRSSELLTAIEKMSDGFNDPQLIFVLTLPSENGGNLSELVTTSPTVTCRRTNDVLSKNEMFLLFEYRANNFLKNEDDVREFAFSGDGIGSAIICNSIAQQHVDCSEHDDSEMTVTGVLMLPQAAGFGRREIDIVTALEGPNFPREHTDILMHVSFVTSTKVGGLHVVMVVMVLHQDDVRVMASRIIANHLPMLEAVEYLSGKIGNVSSNRQIASNPL